MSFSVATDVSPEIEKAFDRTKGQLFFKKRAGLIGGILAQIKFQWTRDIDTACISSTTLYWNPDFFESLDEESRVTVLAHELLHNLLGHGIRLKDRCPDKWNEAGDHVINLLLKADGYYMDGFPYLMDPKYVDWATEDVYDDFDINGAPQPQSGLSGDVVYAETQEEIAEGIGKILNVYTAAKMTCKPGEIPGEVEVFLDEFLNPKLPWNVLLHNYFNQLVEDSYSYARPNRRYDDPILPGFIGRDGLENLHFAADISGSITDQQIIRFFSEGKYIHDELRPETMTLVTFDTEVHDVFRIEREEDYSTFKITGRGGTDLNDLYEFAKKDDATALVIFTDLYVDIPEDPGIPIIWIVVDNPSAAVPYGTLITFNETTGADLSKAA